MCRSRHPSGRDASALVLLVLAVAFALPAVAAAVAVRDQLYAVKAMTPREAWAVGNFGGIYHTSDGGRTWAARESGSKLPLFGVDFADADHGWIVGKSGLILATTDGGRTWRAQASPIPAEKPLFNVAAVDTRTAWVVGDWGALAVTHDGGATWEDRSLGTITIRTEQQGGRVTNTISDDVILYAVSFPDPRHGYVAGEFGTLLATDDGGATWVRRDVGTDKTLFGVGFVTPESGWVVGIDGLILRTRDAGRTWTVQHGSAQPGSIEELGFLETLKNPGLYAVAVTERFGVVVGDTGTLLTSADGGETWAPRELPEKQRLVWMRGVSLAQGSHGFVVGANGFAAAIDDGRVVAPAAPSEGAPER